MKYLEVLNVIYMAYMNFSTNIFHNYFNYSIPFFIGIYIERMMAKHGILFQKWKEIEIRNRNKK